MTRRDLFACGAAGLVLGLGVAATTGGVLRDPGRWGNYDWDYFFFQAFCIHRDIFEFGEWPLWNPWYMGGVPVVGNFQAHFPSPWLLLDLLAGPVVAIKLKIVAHQAIGVAAAYWMARGFRMSRLAAVFVSGTFFFSCWLALRVHSGHLTYLCTAYTPLLVGLFARARGGNRAAAGVWAGGVVALMALQGGVYDLIFAAVLLGPLTVAWCVEDRSFRPLAFAAVVGVWAAGLSAAKLFPVVAYMRENPRLTDQEASAPPQGPASGATTAAPGPAAPAIPPQELVRFVARVFLGREQRSNETVSLLQRFGWHEYGAYVGPLALALALAARWLAGRQALPWLLVAAACLALSAGSYSAYAPWTLLHRLPVFNAMHCPSRFLIPCTFALVVAAGFALDGLRDRFAGRHPRRVTVVLGVLVGAALVDSVLVFRHSVRDAFPIEPPAAPAAAADLVTVLGDRWDMTRPMLANRCTAAGYEPIAPRVWVEPLEYPTYRGEAFFRPDGSDDAAGGAEIVRWTPNTVTVRVAAPTAGAVVLNRNWNKGWRADAPYRAAPSGGLVSAPVPPGEHRVRFVFDPIDFRVGCGVSLATAVLAVVVLFRGRRLRPAN